MFANKAGINLNGAPQDISILSIFRQHRKILLKTNTLAFLTLCHLSKSQLVKRHLANTNRNVRTNNVTNNCGEGAKLGKGMGATDFLPRHLTN